MALTGSINFGGLASGLDTRALIDAILNAERQPVTRLENQRFELNARKSAYGDLLGKLNTFESALRDLSTTRTFRGRDTAVSDDTVLRASAGTAAELGLFSIEVESLAAAHKVKSDGLVSRDQGLVSDGTITIQSGTREAITIDVSAASGNNSLAAIRDAINTADAGVSAAILFDGADYRLSVRATESGLDNALTISDTTNLNLDEAANQVQAAADARLTVDGIEVVSSSNRVTGIIPGVTLDLLDTTPVGQAVTVEINQDVDTVVDAVKDLVEAYNETIGFFNEQFADDSPGPLDGDSTARRIQTRIQSLATGGLDGIPFGEIRSLSAVGIEFDGKTGLMSLDVGELRERLDARFDEVGNLFLPSGRADSPRISYLAATSVTVPGDYAVTLTQAAEQATVAGATALTALSQDETLTVDVDGTSLDVTLTAGQTLSQAIAALNDAFRSADLGVTARDDGGVLRITTSAFGSAIDLSVTSDRDDPGDGTGTGFSTTAATDAGVDVAGTIGGVAATGLGQQLTAGEGTDAVGLVLRVTATAAEIAASGGDFGTLSYSRGLMKTLQAEIESLTRVQSGPIDLARASIENTVESIGRDIESYEYRLSLREAQLVRTFTEAERAISALQSQQSSFGAFSF